MNYLHNSCFKIFHKFHRLTETKKLGNDLHNHLSQWNILILNELINMRLTTST